jgi:tetratricopeptide (TPR) repeat protein
MDRADRLLEEAAQPRPGASELRRVRARVDSRIAARRALTSKALTFGVPLAASLAVALPAWRSFERPSNVPPLPEAPAAVPSTPEEAVAAWPQVTPPPPAPAATEAVAPAKHRHRVVSPPLVSAPIDTLAEETHRLSSAIAQLRREANPAGALQEIDEYRRAYPKAHFASEARMLRIEALIALNYRHEALDELSPAEIPTLPRGEELWVVRGEILLQLSRWQEALDAFDAALRVARTDALIERALAGRAAAQRSLPHR